MKKKEFFEKLKKGDLEGELFGINQVIKYVGSLNSKPSFKVYNSPRKNPAQKVVEMFKESKKFDSKLVKKVGEVSYQIGIYYGGKIEK